MEDTAKYWMTRTTVLYRLVDGKVSYSVNLGSWIPSTLSPAEAEQLMRSGLATICDQFGHVLPAPVNAETPK